MIDSGITQVKDLLKKGVTSNSQTRLVYSELRTGRQEDKRCLRSRQPCGGHCSGNGNASTGGSYTRTFGGSAPAANLINLRVLNNYGMGTDSAIIAAIERAIALKDTYNIRVINLSLGRPVFESYTQDPLCLAVERPGWLESSWLRQPVMKAVITLWAQMGMAR